MFFDISEFSIPVGYIFFGLLSFLIYRSLSIEDAKKYKHLDFIMIVLLGLFTFESIQFIELFFEKHKLNYISIVYLVLPFFIGFISAVAERAYYHIIIPRCTDLFSKLGVDSKDLDSNKLVLSKLLQNIYRAIHERKKVPIDGVILEITFNETNQKIKGYLLGHSCNDINIGVHGNGSITIMNISLKNVNMIKFVMNEEYNTEIY